MVALATAIASGAAPKLTHVVVERNAVGGLPVFKALRSLHEQLAAGQLGLDKPAAAAAQKILEESAKALEATSQSLSSKEARGTTRGTDEGGSSSSQKQRENGEVEVGPGASLQARILAQRNKALGMRG